MKLEQHKCPTCNGTGLVEYNFGERLKQLREKRKWTQQELADRTEGAIGRPQIANMEAGRSETTFATLIKLAVVFDVTTDYLLGAPERGEKE